MSILGANHNFVLLEGDQGGETFSFSPAHSPVSSVGAYDLLDSDVFSISESTFVYIEGLVAREFPNWWDGHRYGLASLSEEAWRNILSGLSALHEDLKNAVPLEDIIDRYAIQTSFLDKTHNFNRENLIGFLNQFAARIAAMIDRYPYVVIGGI